MVIPGRDCDSPYSLRSVILADALHFVYRYGHIWLAG